MLRCRFCSACICSLATQAAGTCTQAPALRTAQCHASGGAAIETSLQPFHLAFPVRDLDEAREFYGRCVRVGNPCCSRCICRALPDTLLPAALLLTALVWCRKLGCPEGRSAATWQDYSLYGHQIVCHHVKGYSAVASRNAGMDTAIHALRHVLTALLSSWTTPDTLDLLCGRKGFWMWLAMSVLA